MSEEFELEGRFISYYTTSFSRDLSRWFEIKKNFDGKAIGFIPEAARNLASERSQRCSEVDEYGFSIACFYTFLIPQVVALAAGTMDAFYLFSQASGWPILSCGLGGFMSPAAILREASLEPYPNERKFYISMMKSVKNYFVYEIEKFLAGNDANLDFNAYGRLCELSHGKIEEISKNISKQVDAYVSYLEKESEYPDYLMSAEFMYGSN